jgi:hypothetical protein
MSLEALLGSGRPKACRVVSKDVSVHWWSLPCKEGDLCLCGTLPYQFEEEEDLGLEPPDGWEDEP